jgi:hypothetical protein
MSNISDMYKPKCVECERPYDLQESKPVMNGSDRMTVWMTLFISCAISTSVYLVTRYASHLNEIEKSQYETCIKARPSEPQLCSQQEANKPQCAPERRSYTCCVSEDSAKQLGCWR